MLDPGVIDPDEALHTLQVTVLELGTATMKSDPEAHPVTEDGSDCGVTPIWLVDVTPVSVAAVAEFDEQVVDTALVPVVIVVRDPTALLSTHSLLPQSVNPPIATSPVP